MSSNLHTAEPLFENDFQIAPLELSDKVSIVVSVIYKKRIKLDQIELPLNHRERTNGDVIRDEICNLENGRFKPVVVVKTTNPEKPFRLLRGDNRYDACVAKGMKSIPCIIENRFDEGLEDNLLMDLEE